MRWPLAVRRHCGTHDACVTSFSGPDRARWNNGADDRVHRPARRDSAWKTTKVFKNFHVWHLPPWQRGRTLNVHTYTKTRVWQLSGRAEPYLPDCDCVKYIYRSFFPFFLAYFLYLPCPISWRHARLSTSFFFRFKAAVLRNARAKQFPAVARMRTV